MLHSRKLRKAEHVADEFKRLVQVAAMCREIHDHMDAIEQLQRRLPSADGLRELADAFHQERELAVALRAVAEMQDGR